MRKKKESVIQETLAEVTGLVSEMTNANVDIQIPAETIESLKSKDKNPLFVTAEILRPTKSANGNIYTENFLYKLRDEINSKKPFAYSGHLQDQERSSKRPKAQTIWLYSEVKEMDGQKRLYAKGYVFPRAKSLRDELEVGNLVKKHIPVSIYGTATKEFNSSLNGYEITAFNLESIDWARDLAQGVKTAGAINISKESKMDRNEVIKSLTKEELLSLREDLVQEIKKDSESVVSEMATTLAVEPEKVLETISEMKSQNEKLVKDVEAKDSQISTLQETVNNQELKNILKKRVKNHAARAVIEKLSLAEMKAGKTPEEASKAVLESEVGKGVISEMTASIPENNMNDKNHIESNKYINKR